MLVRGRGESAAAPRQPTDKTPTETPMSQPTALPSPANIPGWIHSEVTQVLSTETELDGIVSGCRRRRWGDGEGGITDILQSINAFWLEY